MSDSRQAGIAFIVGTFGGFLTMAIHPHGHDTCLALVSGIAHSVALISLLVLFLGACGLARLLNGTDRLAFSALVVFAFGLIAALNAGAVSGFIIPGIMRLMEHDATTAAFQWRIAIASIFQINQAFSRIYSIAVCAAILLWSVCTLRQGCLSRTVAIYGCLVPPLVALLIIVGHLRMDLHGFTVVVAVQSLWFLGTGVALCRNEASPAIADHR